MTDPSDEFGKELEAQGKALRAREQEVAKTRQTWTGAVFTYANFLRSKGRPIPDFVTAALEPEPSAMDMPSQYDGVSRVVRYAKPRIGEKRKQVLVYIAKATREGRHVTTQELIDSGVEQHVANNVVWHDTKREMLRRIAAKSGKHHEYQMTDIGYEVLHKAGIDI